MGVTRSRPLAQFDHLCQALLERLVKGVKSCQCSVHSDAAAVQSTLLQSITGASIKFPYPWWVSLLGPLSDLATPMTVLMLHFTEVVAIREWAIVLNSYMLLEGLDCNLTCVQCLLCRWTFEPGGVALSRLLARPGISHKP